MPTEARSMLIEARIGLRDATLAEAHTMLTVARSTLIKAHVDHRDATLANAPVSSSWSTS